MTKHMTGTREEWLAAPPMPGPNLSHDHQPAVVSSTVRTAKHSHRRER
jgi:hypothetical protein